MQRGRIEEMAIIVVPTVLGEIQLFLYLRYKKRSLLLTTKKKGPYLGAAGATNQSHLPNPNMAVLRG
jgi:hypothetical protein